MQIILACAKTMNSSAETAVPLLTTPRFDEDARRFAMELSRWQVEDLQQALHCSEQIARDNHLRYHRFFDGSEKLPAVLGYFGQAYKHLRAASFNDADFLFAQKHLFITSFLYGLLRPLDYIHPYRLEGKIRLEATDGITMFDYWKPRLTDFLIDAVKADDGILVHLATEEMEHLFDWKRVRREVRVVQPLFYEDRGDVLKAVSVYAKSCRGAMTRHIIKNRLAAPSQLLDFELEGYAYNERYGDADHPHFILNKMRK